MANYPRVTPATLTNFAAVINDPLTGETANKVSDFTLQTRQFVYDFLALKFDSAASDALKAAPITDTSLAGKVKGSTSNAGTQQAVVQGTISTPDLRDAAVIAAKIGDGEVATAKIGDLQVTTGKLNDGAVTTQKITDAQVTTAKMAAGSVDSTVLKSTASAEAVTTAHIRDLAVTAAKIAANVVDGTKLMLSGSASPRILVGDAAQKFQSVALSGDASITAAGVLTLTAIAAAVVREKAANTVAGGTTIAGGAAFATPNLRGSTVAWDKQFETVASMVTLPGSGKIQLTAGTYVIEVSVPAYSAGLHVCRVGHYLSDNSLSEYFYGSAEVSPVGVSSRTRCQAKLVMLASDYILIHHWTELVKGTNGMGLPCSAGADEVYSQVIIRKLSS